MMYRSLLFLAVPLFVASSAMGAIIESSDIEDDGTWITGTSSLQYLPATQGISPTAGDVTFHFNDTQAQWSGTNFIIFDSLLEEGVYTATIDVGNYANAGLATIGDVGMTAGGVLLTPTSSQITAPTSGSVQTWTYTYSIQSGDPNIGEAIGFTITVPNLGTGGTGNISFDNLNIDYEPLSAEVPEPTSLATLGGLVSIFGLGYLRRRRKQAA